MVLCPRYPGEVHAGKSAVPHHIQYGSRHSDMTLGKSGDGRGGRNRGIQEGGSDTDCTIFVNDELLSYPQLSRIQEALYILMGLFDWVGLRKNVNKTICMQGKGRWSGDQSVGQNWRLDPWRHTVTPRMACTPSGIVFDQINFSSKYTFRSIHPLVISDFIDKP